jgi:CDP-6-deoxy-D-xylo-4-hexulose-3-dehydrase
MYLKQKSKFLNYLNANGIETRPILSGNFLNQPSSQLYKLNKNRLKFKISEQIEKRGFFIGLPTTSLSKEKLAMLEKKLLSIEQLK